MSFDHFGLDPRLMTGIDNEGFIEPTPIQEKAIPVAMAGHDIIGTAQTGTGKTAAFALPILNKLLKGPHDRARALIVTPTRELAEQIHEMVQALGAGTKVRSATIYGGVNAGPQIKALRNGVEILVACPGRLLDLIENGPANLTGLEIVVLDEGDRMLDMGFLPAVRRILKYVPENRQTMLFSATFPPEIEELARKHLRHPEKVALGLRRPVHTVTHALFPVEQHLKTRLLMALLEKTDTESVLIFTRTKHKAKRLAQQLGRKNYKVTSLHSNRTQAQRQSALKGFKKGIYQIMVATDIAARGLDVETVSHVINYDMPDTTDAYIHRIGRTGRAERAGDALTFTTPQDGDMIKALEKIMKEKLVRETLADFDYDRVRQAPPPPRKKKKTPAEAQPVREKPKKVVEQSQPKEKSEQSQPKKKSDQSDERGRPGRPRGRRRRPSRGPGRSGGSSRMYHN